MVVITAVIVIVVVAPMALALIMVITLLMGARITTGACQVAHVASAPLNVVGVAASAEGVASALSDVVSDRLI